MRIHSYVNTERKLDQAIVNGKFTRPNVQRTYYYIDYHDFTDVVKYRLAVMRLKLEATLKVASAPTAKQLASRLLMHPVYIGSQSKRLCLSTLQETVQSTRRRLACRPDCQCGEIRPLL